MLLSIVIPVYNTAFYLRKCLDSVIFQGEDDYEIVLIDDGSTDGVCPGICDEYRNRYPLIINLRHMENGGTGSARNAGIRLAKGEYICFLDSDDYLLPGSLAAMKKALKQFSPDVLQFAYQIEKNGHTVDEVHANFPTNRMLHLDEIPELIIMSPMVCNRVWKRSMFTKYDIGFPERVWFEDLRTSLKLLTKAQGIVSIREALYVYVQREGSTMHSTNIERYAEILEAVQDLVTWFKGNGLWEKYYYYISRMAVFQIFIFVGTRVARQDPKHPMLETFHVYLRDTFPEYNRNPLLDLKKLSRHNKVMLILMYRRNYRMIRWLDRHFQR